MSELATVAKCRLCDKTFTGPAVVILGKGAHSRLVSFIQTLKDHIATDHKDALGWIGLKLEEFKGWRFLRCYQTNDKELTQQTDIYRWNLHQETLNGRMSDEAIERKSAELAAEIVRDCEAEYARVIRAATNGSLLEATEATAMLKRVVAMKLKMLAEHLRDELQEPGKYPVNQPETPQNSLPPKPVLSN